MLLYLILYFFRSAFTAYASVHKPTLQNIQNITDLIKKQNQIIDVVKHQFNNSKQYITKIINANDSEESEYWNGKAYEFLYFLKIDEISLFNLKKDLKELEKHKKNNSSLDELSKMELFVQIEKTENYRENVFSQLLNYKIQIKSLN
ncbi:hypothetical protein EHP00_1189 [Ecytonucleospora hepatopenaei]|uniref:Uncharacterized protein n=1 Tax=Ecytonucleospora hepatopenaei TaxID=646526 RepID=A0A1W0E898_9MICR|nr:hypothetical protein EHP00_1189 [Ecytonucleospora hepatopenaei]